MFDKNYGGHLFNTRTTNIESENSQRILKITHIDAYSNVLRCWTKNETHFNDKENVEADKKRGKQKESIVMMTMALLITRKI